MGPKEPFTGTYRVGRWTVRWKVNDIHESGGSITTVEWDPALPDRRLTEKEMRQYLKGRHEMMTKLAEAIGGRVLVVDV